jgi:hypothetical protein
MAEIDDDWDDEFTDYTFHLLMCELERTNEKIKSWENEKENNNNLKID